MLSALLLEILASVFIPQLSSIFFIVCGASADVNAVDDDAFVDRNDQAGPAVDDFGADQICVVRVDGDFDLWGGHFKFVCFHQVDRVECRLLPELAAAGLMEGGHLFVGDTVIFENIIDVFDIDLGHFGSLAFLVQQQTFTDFSMHRAHKV